MNPIKKLLLEYKVTRRNVNKDKEQINVEIDEKKSEIDNLTKDFLRAKSNKEDVNDIIDKIVELRMDIRTLKEKKKNFLSDLSNLNYAIQWMETSRCPSSRRGAENRKGYNKRVKYNSEWIKHQSYQKQDLDELSDSALSEKEEENKLKSEFVKNIMSTLTMRQIEVLELSANGYNQPEISEILGISQQAVSRIIKRYEQKIKEEGWMLL